LKSFKHDAWLFFGAPLVEGLRSLKIEPGARLVFLSQDYLARMPIWLAEDPQSGLFLGDLYRITSATNLASMTLQTRTPNKGVAAWFNDSANPTLELTALARQLFIGHGAVTTLIGRDEAKEPESLIDSLQGHKEWFFWTHGHFDRYDARRSFLQLEGGGQTDVAPELSVGALLDARFGPRGPDLVVLSACESGLADVSQDDELVGLPMALLQAGARGVISAMWPVREDATALLMAKFGELSIDKTRRPSEALRLAALWLRSASAADLVRYVDMGPPDLIAGSDIAKGYDRLMEALQDGDAPGLPFADPYFWAAFNFMGVD
jgi:CHAT domain-containing protein